MPSRLLICSALLMPYVSAIAQQDDPAPSVAVTGTKDPDWKPYRNMVDGMDAFEKYHALAPAAALKFVLRPQQAKLPMADLKLRIAGDSAGIDVPIAPDATFSLPRDELAFKENADLRLNVKKGLYRWRPDIHTPGVQAGARRLGDLRLECEVRWAVDQFDSSFLTRTYLTTLGGACHSSRGRVFYTAPQPFTGVTLIDGARREKLPTERLDPKDPARYAPPIHDDSWSNDTLVQFES